MSAIFSFQKGATKKTQIIDIFKRLFVTGSPIDMNVDVFLETSVGFLKSVVLQLFPKYSQSNVNLNIKSRVVLVFSVWMLLVELYKSFVE